MVGVWRRTSTKQLSELEVCLIEVSIMDPEKKDIVGLIAKVIAEGMKDFSFTHKNVSGLTTVRVCSL